MPVFPARGIGPSGSRSFRPGELGLPRAGNCARALLPGDKGPGPAARAASPGRPLARPAGRRAAVAARRRCSPPRPWCPGGASREMPEPELQAFRLCEVIVCIFCRISPLSTLDHVSTPNHEDRPKGLNVGLGACGAARRRPACNAVATATAAANTSAQPRNAGSGAIASRPTNEYMSVAAAWPIDGQRSGVNGSQLPARTAGARRRPCGPRGRPGADHRRHVCCGPQDHPWALVRN
jgi:hypothetical protein